MAYFLTLIKHNTFCDPHRDEPRTRARQILDILVSVDENTISPVVTDLEAILLPEKKPNPGWEKLKEFNQKRYVAKVKKERNEEWRAPL